MSDTFKRKLRFAVTFRETPDILTPDGKNAQVIEINPSDLDWGIWLGTDDEVAAAVRSKFELVPVCDGNGWVIDPETVTAVHANKQQGIMDRLVTWLGGERTEDGEVTCEVVIETEVEFSEVIDRPGDGTHCGPADWYPEIEEKIVAALAKGPQYAWRTEWLGCKKEIMSSRLTCFDGKIIAEVSCSNDFDTNGMGEVTITWSNDLDAVNKAVYAAADAAVADMKDNDPVTMYAVGEVNPHTGERRNWSHTYLIDSDPHCCGMNDSPPGDDYHRWGWQDLDEDDDTTYTEVEDYGKVPADFPVEVAKVLMDGMDSLEKKIVAGNWVAELAE